MPKLERIKGYLRRAPHWGVGQQDGEFLLYAIEQLARMARLLLGTMNEFGREKYLNILDPDIRELVDISVAPSDGPE